MLRKNLALLIFQIISFATVAQVPDVNSFGDKANSSKAGPTDLFDNDLYTGHANVRIPIYDYSVDNLDLGVSLSYRTTGIRVNDFASSVGLGWNLNAGGYIERQVNGIQDEMTYPSVATPFKNQYQGNWVTPQYDNNKTDRELDVFTAVFGGRSVQFVIEFERTNTNFAQVYEIQTSPKSEIQVDIYYNNQPVYLCGIDVRHLLPTGISSTSNFSNAITFKITDESGNQFFFERGDYEKKQYFEHTMYPVEKWNLTKIITYTGQTVLYSYYEFNNVEKKLYKDQRVREAGSEVVSQKTPNDVWVNVTFWGAISKIADSLVYWKGTLSHIKDIRYPNGVKVEFNLDQSKYRVDLHNTRALQSIDILGSYNYGGNNSYYFNRKRFEFDYAYFKTNVGEDSYNTVTNITRDDYRLKLKGIRTVSNDLSTSEPYYTFEYNNTILPDRLSPCSDYYGYFNNKYPDVAIVTLNGVQSAPWEFQDLAIPVHTFNTTLQGNIPASITYGQDRTPDINYAKASVLTKVINGEGGSVQFNYISPPNLSYVEGTQQELNRYYTDGDSWHFYDDPPQAINTSDGLCVASMVYRDGYNQSNTYTKNFTYEEGVRFYKGLYMWYPLLLHRDYPVTHVVSRAWQNNFTANVELINGSNHGYSKVTEEVISYTGAEFISKTEYQFTNLLPRGTNIEFENELSIDQVQMNWVPRARIRPRLGFMHHTYKATEVHRHRMGLLYKQKDYDALGNVMKETTYKYKINGFADNNNLRIEAQYNNNIANSNFNPLGMSYPQCFEYFNCDVIGTQTDNPIFQLVGDASDNENYGFIENRWASFFCEGIKVYNTNVKTTAGGNTLEQNMFYQYDINDNLKEVSWTNSAGELFKRKYTYADPLIIKHGYTPILYWGSTPLSIDTVVQKIQHPVAEQLVKVDPNNNNNEIELSYEGVIPLPTTTYYMPAGNSQSSNFDFSGSIKHLISQAGENHQTTPMAIKAKEYTRFDTHGNPVETRFNEQEVYESCLWDTRLGKKGAVVSNAKYDEVAATSFEGHFNPYGSADENKGNWDFTPLNAEFTNQTVKPVTGNFYYVLEQYKDLVTTISTKNGKKYLLTFWARIPGFEIWHGSQQITDIESYTAIGGWTFYTAELTGSGNPITFKVTSSQLQVPLDEVRLHPINASMTTYTYEPLFGTGSQCDERNDILKFEYDQFGRQTTIRDIRGNILSHTKFTKQGPNN